MKIFVSLFGAVLCLPAFALAGWITVDNPALAEKGGFAWTMIRGPGGHVFVNGENGDSSLVRMADAYGTHWATVDTFKLASGMGAQAGPLASWGNQVYAGHQLQDAQGNWHWIIRKSENGGRTWATSNNWPLPTGKGYSEIRAMAIDHEGRIYVSGYLTNYMGISTQRFVMRHAEDYQSSWVVRASFDHGKSWSTVDYYHGIDKQGADASGIAVDKAGNVYVVGEVNATDTTGKCDMISHQIMRFSGTHGKTWTNHDFYLNPGQCWDFPVMLHIDDFGNLYTAGSEGIEANGGFQRSSYVRASFNHGLGWKTLDHFVFPGGTDTEGYVVRTDSSGNILVGGHGRDANKVNNWFIRLLTPKGARLLDSYKGESGLGARVDDILFDRGAFLATGIYARDKTGVPALATRKYVP